MPYITPENLPEDDDCRPLYIPASTDWLAIVSGALTELQFKWNWQQTTGITVDEAIERVNVMLAAYYDGCPVDEPCTTPGGFPIFRVSPDDGLLEELGGDGVWRSPYGDYAIPALPVRGDADPTCIAAANASNVLQQVYESLTDSFADGLGKLAAFTVIAETLTALVGAVFGPIAIALMPFELAAFAAIYEAVSYISADLWDEAFTNSFVCVLKECATNTDGVVTFDFACVQQKLYDRVEFGDITETALRLYGQLSFIINAVGGSDALNAMGATTAITEWSCGCDEWCWTLDFGDGDGGFTGYTDGCFGLMTEYEDGVWQAVEGLVCPPDTYATTCSFTRTLPNANYTFIQLRGHVAFGVDGAAANGVTLVVDGETVGANYHEDDTWDIAWTGDKTGALEITLNGNAGFQSGAPCGGSCSSYDVLYRGNGENPFGTDNC